MKQSTEYVETNKSTEYIETTKPTKYIETTKPTEYIGTDKHSENIENNDQCIIDDILNGECDHKITSDLIEKVHSYLQDHINKDSNEIYKTENAIFQISTLEEQKNSNDPDTSSIDIGECEGIK